LGLWGIKYPGYVCSWDFLFGVNALRVLTILQTNQLVLFLNFINSKRCKCVVGRRRNNGREYFINKKILCKKQVGPGVFIITIVIIGVYPLLTTPYFDNRLRTNHVVVRGTILNLPSNGKTVNVEFEFNVYGKNYHHNMPCPKNVLKNHRAGYHR